MKASTLLLDDYVFSEACISCEFKDNWPAKPLKISVSDIGFEVQVMNPDPEDIPGIKTVRVKVFNAEKENCDTCYYKFSMEAFIRVSFNSENDAEKHDPERGEKILVINATNLLYGIIRERLRSTTANMLWGAVTLPLVTFDGLSKIPDQISESDNSKAIK